MRLSVIVLVAFLWFVGSAHAKSLTGIEVCGESDCASAAIGGFDRSPLDDRSAGQPPPAIGPFYRIVFEVEGHRETTWRVYYEPTQGLARSRPRRIDDVAALRPGACPDRQAAGAECGSLPDPARRVRDGRWMNRRG